MAENLSAILAAAVIGMSLSNPDKNEPPIDISIPGSSSFHTTTYTQLPNNEVSADITFNCFALREAFPKAAFDSPMFQRHLARIDVLEQAGSISAEHPVVEMRKHIPTLFAENIYDMYKVMGVKEPTLSFDLLKEVAEQRIKGSEIESVMAETPEAQRALDEEKGRPYIRRATVSCLGIS